MAGGRWTWGVWIVPSRGTNAQVHLAMGDTCRGAGRRRTGLWLGTLRLAHWGFSRHQAHTEEGREVQWSPPGWQARSYLSDVFKGKLSSRQAGRANGGLAHWQPRRPGYLLCGPGQLGRLPSLNVDSVETWPRGSDACGEAQAAPVPGCPQPGTPHFLVVCRCQILRGQAP